MKRRSLWVHMVWPRIAFCTALVIAMIAPTGRSAAVSAADAQGSRDLYRAEQIDHGAQTIPVLSQLERELAAEAVRDGEKDRAEEHLRLSLRYDPDDSRAYFALAKLKFTRAQLDAPVYLIQGLGSLVRTFGNQRLLAVNAASALSYVLLLLNLVICVALAIKYLPYAAHKLTERLRRRFNATLPVAAAYLLLLAPALLFAGTIIPLAYLTVLCWLSMYRREKALVIVLVAPLIAAGFLDTHIRLTAVLANPKSLTSLIDRANTGRADENLTQAIEQTSCRELDAEKNLALGILYAKDKQFYDASDRFFKAISLKPADPIGYINLGNVHFLQGDYEKALQGYRKAESIDAADPICQYNLAQAYIKTLLMKEASRALQRAGKGIDKEKSRYADDAFESVVVLPRLFSDKDLWRLALVEAKSLDEQRTAEGFVFFPWLPRRTGAAAVLVTLVLAIVLSVLVKPENLAFPCSNCGKLTCSRCCSTERGSSLCRECAGTIESVSSEKVVQALLRQKRQTALARRRKSMKWITIVLPGVRDIHNGHVARGTALALVFSASVAFLFMGNGVLCEPGAPESHALTVRLAAAAGIAAAYALSARSKPGAAFKYQRHRTGAKEAAAPNEEPATGQSAETR